MIKTDSKNICRGHAFRIAVGITVLALMLADVAGAQVPISSCRTISEPGEYVLTTNIMDSQAKTCISITSSDVIFDGTGYRIDGIDAYGTGVYVYTNPGTTLTNVTIKNLAVTDWMYGIYYLYATNGGIVNNTASSNSRYGIFLDYLSNNNTLSSNIVNLNEFNGIYLRYSSDNTIYNNYFNNTNNNDAWIDGYNIWNVTETVGTNIIGKPYIGGNFWGHPNGTGFSQTCADGNGDGICDTNNTLNTLNIDYLPLAATSLDIAAPGVSNASANQSVIPDDTDYAPLWGETAQLNVTVIDYNGVASVTVNLSEIGGEAAKHMVNIGGDVYSTTANASAGTLPKLYNLTVNATDIFGNSNTSVKIQLRVMKNGDCTGNGVVNIGDALRLANNVSYPGNPAYYLSSPYVCEVTGNGLINIGDALRLANNVSYPGDPRYILK